MARLIRANSETPNVANNDDFRLLRYAIGGYDGVVKKLWKRVQLYSWRQ